MINSNNVIEFPKSESPVVKTEQDLRKDMNEQKRTMIEELVDFQATTLLSNMAMTGVNTDTDSFIKDFTFITESIKSLYYRLSGFDHPFHPMINEIVNIEDKQEYVPWDPLNDDFED